MSATLRFRGFRVRNAIRIARFHHSCLSRTSGPLFMMQGLPFNAKMHKEIPNQPPKKPRLAQAALITAILGFGLTALEDQYPLDWSKLRKFYAEFVDSYGMKAVRMFDPETAHFLAVLSAKWGLAPQDWTIDPKSLHITVWDLPFSNPVGLAAGFDKHGEAVDGLLSGGFGFVEVGSVTPEAQPGNPKPRMFRLWEDLGVINRYGFNSQGLVPVAERLRQRLDRKRSPGIVGVNVGKNKDSESAEVDYSRGIRALGPYADYVVVNVSCPNQKGVAQLQEKGTLGSIIKASQQARNQLHKKIPLLVKISPDLDDEGKKEVARVCLETGVDGLIVTNTTVTRPASLASPNKEETGGLSGLPLKQLSTDTIREMYQLTRGEIPIIGCGGVGSAEDVLEKIEAGATLVQIYSMMVYLGPGCILKIKEDLAQLLAQKGYTTISQAVGAANQIKTYIDKKQEIHAEAQSIPEITPTKRRRWWLLWLL